jgi:hypothetical protein
MSQSSADVEFLLQSDWINSKIARLGTELWFPAYRIDDSQTQRLAFFSALIPKSRIKTVIRRRDWDISIGHGSPGYETVYKSGDQEIKYFHFYEKNQIQPLILVRQFHNVKPDYIEILEEFRLFHNLYHVQKNNTYIKFVDAHEDEVIKTTENSVEIRLKELIEFLAAKQMYLALYFECIRFSQVKASSLPQSHLRRDIIESLLSYHLVVNDYHWAYKEVVSFSRLCGKKLIPPPLPNKSGVWPYEPQKKYEEFIIGVNSNGDELRFSCDEEKLANFFGKNPDAPNYLTPVFFRRSILEKYYANPDKYSISDGFIECIGAWGLRVDNNHDNYVVVFLGDLGTLPNSEQKYWQSYNISPDGGLSDVAWRRGFQAEFAESSDLGFLFKYNFREFQRLWFKKYSWHPFKPLVDTEQYLFKSLRVPLNDGQHEFDNQLLALTKLLVESINDQEIVNLLGSNLEGGERGIAKLEKFFIFKNVQGYEQHITFLKNIWKLRSLTTHRKGQNYAQEATRVGLTEKGLKEDFKMLLKQSVDFIIYLKTAFSLNES